MNKASLIKQVSEKTTIRGEREKEQEVVVRHEASRKRRQAQYGAGMKSLQQN